jgi:hypothetical protein
MLASSTRFWLAVGIPENWHTAFDFNCIWGLKRNQRHFWEAIKENTDIVFFYATRPVGGVIGYGTVLEKIFQDSPLWPEERATNEVIWPLRFYFDVKSALSPAAWREHRIILPEVKSRVRMGFQALDPSLAADLLRGLPEEVPQGLILPHAFRLREAFPLRPRESLAGVGDPHNRARDLLVEIGRFQKFVAQAEFPLENRRLDVVWRRVQRAVPSYAFEVQVSGNLTEAMGKLKQARDLWNSNVCLVGKEEHRSAVNQLLAGTFHEIQDHLRFIELAQVEELYQRKRAYREFEHQLGILA